MGRFLPLTRRTSEGQARSASLRGADDHVTVSEVRAQRGGYPLLTAVRLIGAISLIGGMALIEAASPAGATGSSLYASPTGTGNCTSVAQACTLTTALSEAGAGSYIYLTKAGTQGSSGTYYEGNFTVAPTGTTATSPLTIEPVAGVTNPILSNDGGSSSGCPTSTCEGAVLTIGSNAYVDMSGITIANAENDGDGTGGAIDNNLGGNLIVFDSSFTDDSGGDGGAIDNGDVGPIYLDGSSGTLTVSDSTFSDDSGSLAGGAIDNGDNGGTGTLTVLDSTFSSDSGGNGGAIDNGYGEDEANGSLGTLTVSDSTFSGDSALYDGGAIDNGDFGGTGTATISDSTFSQDSGGSGGAIDNGESSGNGILKVSDSTFSSDSTAAGGNGGAIDNADSLDASINGSSGTATISASTFSGNSLDSTGVVEIGVGVDIANDAGGDATGVLNLAANLFADADSCAGSGYGTISDAGYNVGVDSSCENGGIGDQVSSSAADLSPLANNGGLTETMLPSGGNLAVALVPDPTSVTLNGTTEALCPTTDQRGVVSAAGTGCDAGSVQYYPPFLYASPAGTGSCVLAAQACTLATALTKAGAGYTIYLTQLGTQGTASTYYVGNWTVDPTGTTAAKPLTIEPRPGLVLAAPILSGNGGSSSNCPTTTCNGPELNIDSGVHLDLVDLSIENADNTASGKTNGGAIDNNDGGNITISDSTFSSDTASDDGGAIDNADDGSGTLTISDSTFSSDNAGDDGGAIDNADDGGSTLR